MENVMAVLLQMNKQVETLTAEVKNLKAVQETTASAIAHNVATVLIPSLTATIVPLLTVANASKTTARSSKTTKTAVKLADTETKSDTPVISVTTDKKQHPTKPKLTPTAWKNLKAFIVGMFTHYPADLESLFGDNDIWKQLVESSKNEASPNKKAILFFKNLSSNPEYESSGIRQNIENYWNQENSVRVGVVSLNSVNAEEKSPEAEAEEKL
jgi:hypothetical protein